MKITKVLKDLHIPIPDNFITEEIFRVTSENTGERLIETPLVLNAIPHKLSKVLDIGCRYSLLPIQLASVGHTVHGIDLKPYRKTHPNFSFFHESILNSSLKSGFYDVAISLSTIEHIGLDVYSGGLDKDGDKKAVKEVKRVLKKGGLFIFTAPFGMPKDTEWYRVYNIKRIERALTGFSIKEVRVFKLEKNHWLPCSVKEGEKIDSTTEVRSAFFLKAVKK